MYSTEKLSRGTYGLRKVAMKKKLNSDFEYYFSNSDRTIDSETEMKKQKEVKKSDTISISVQNSESSPKNHSQLKTYLLYSTNVESSSAEDEETSIQDNECSALLVESFGGEDVVSEDDKLPREEMKPHIFQNVVNLNPNDVVAHVNTEKEEEEYEMNYSDSSPESTPHVVIHNFSDIGVEEINMADNGKLEGYLIQNLTHLNPNIKIECDKCHKLLKPSSFRQHLRTHTGEKPHGCKMCSSRFTRKGDVERHVRIVHEKQKPFKCSRCPRAFGDRKNLRWHLMNHDKKLFYVCSVCDFKFGKKEYWENHVRYIHPVEEDNAKESQDAVTTGDSGKVGEKSPLSVKGLKLPTAPTQLKLTAKDKCQSPSESIEAVVIRFDENGSVSSSEVEQLPVANREEANLLRIASVNEGESESSVFEVRVGEYNISEVNEGVISLVMSAEHVTSQTLAVPLHSAAIDKEYCT